MRYDVCYTKGFVTVCDGQPYDGILVWTMLNWEVVKSFDSKADAIRYMEDNMKSIYVVLGYPMRGKALVIESFVLEDVGNGEDENCVAVADWEIL